MKRTLPLIAALVVATLIVIAAWPPAPDPVCEYSAEALGIAEGRGTPADDLRATHEARCDHRNRLRKR